MKNLITFKMVVFALVLIIIGCSHNTKKPEDVKDTENAEFYFKRGFEQQNNGKLDQAISDYDKAIEINPVYADAYFNRGNAYKDKGQLAQAIIDYSKAIEINPEDFAAYNNRGIAFIENRQLAEGCNDLAHTCELGNCNIYNYVKLQGLCK